MTASASDRDLLEHCRASTLWPQYVGDLHGQCRGTHEYRLPPKPPETAGPLITTFRCDCPCHEAGSRPAGLTEDPTR